MENSNKAPALHRAMSILELLEKQGKCGAADIISHLALPKSSAYLLLEEMKKLKLLRQDSQGNYQLWVRLVALGHAASSQLDLPEMARKHLMCLMEDTGLLCHFGILDGSSAYYILKVESYSTITVRSHEGKVIALNRSGVGKCLLAWQSPAELARIWPALEFTRETATTITDPVAFRQELARIREQGWAFDDSEDVEGVRCVAAPVFGTDGTLIGAISAVGARHQLEDARIAELVGKVRACAKAISAALDGKNNH